MSIAELGGGSWVMGILLLIFGLIGLINAYAAFVMWAKAFFDLLKRKTKSTFGIWFSIIVVTFGWYALFEILTMIP